MTKTYAAVQHAPQKTAPARVYSMEHENMKTYSIWLDNGVAVEIESESMTTALDQFCADAGYIDHADYCQQMGLASSPFNIVEVTP